MEKAVDEVISRLAEIEDTANRMNDAVEVRKKRDFCRNGSQDEGF